MLRRCRIGRVVPCVQYSWILSHKLIMFNAAWDPIAIRINLGGVLRVRNESETSHSLLKFLKSPHCPHWFLGKEHGSHNIPHLFGISLRFVIPILSSNWGAFCGSPGKMIQLNGTVQMISFARAFADAVGEDWHVEVFMMGMCLSESNSSQFIDVEWCWYLWKTKCYWTSCPSN